MFKNVGAGRAGCVELRDSYEAAAADFHRADQLVLGPIIVIPAELKDDPGMQLRIVTPAMAAVDFHAGQPVKLKRYDGYAPTRNTRTQRFRVQAGLLRHRVFRIVTESGARVAGLKTGELQGVEDLPTSRSRFKKDKNVTIVPLPTGGSRSRSEHLRPAHGQSAGAQGDPGGPRHGRDHGCGDRRQLQAQCRFPVSRTSRATPTPARRPTTSRIRPGEGVSGQAGYKGEPIVLLTNKGLHFDVQPALVMAEQ